MTRFAAILVVLLIAVFASAGAKSQEQDDAAKAKTLAGLQAIVPSIRSSKIITENYAMCPLERGKSRDLAAKFGDWLAGGEPDDADCAVAVQECWKACEANIAWACRDLGNISHDYSDTIGKDITRRLYAQGCALGDANACTNRAANIVNATWEGDPVEPLDEAKRAQCTIVMYDDACAESEYWGCSQVALERAGGHESIRDQAKAAAAEKKACLINAEDEGDDPSNC